MILPGLAAIAIAALILIAISHNHRQMNSVCIGQSVLFAALAGSVLASQSLPMIVLDFGNRYFFIDHLGIYEILITVVIFTLAGVYARGYVGSLIESGELGKGSVKLFYAAWVLLLLLVL